MSTTDPLSRVTGMDLATFAATCWGREPLLRRAAELPGDGFGDLLSLDDVDELVSRRGLRTPFVRMARDGSVLPATRFTRGGGAGAEIADQVADDKVLGALADGATLVLQGLHRTWPPVVALAAALSDQLGHPTQVNAYLTPPQSTGFDPHYDVHDVFVLQVAGRKRWRVHAPVLEAPLRDQPWDARRDEVAARAAEEPLLDVVLEAGDSLYLPRGHLHAATALGEVSGHLTVGVQPVTGAFLAEQVLGLLADDADLRASLPAGVDLTDPAVLEPELDTVRSALHTAVDRLDAATLGRSVHTHLARTTRPEPVSPLAQLAAADALTAGSTVRRRSGLRWRLEDEDDQVALRCLDKTLRVPAALAPGLRRALAGDPVRVDGLGLGTDDATRLVARLLREGVVVPDPTT